MPQLKSAEKRLRQSVKRRRQNRAVKSTIKTDTRRLLQAIEKGDREGARQSLKQVFSRLDSAAAKTKVKKNYASRHKSRLARRVETMVSR